MKKLLALTALVGTTVSIATACGTDTLAMVDAVKVEGFDYTTKAPTCANKTGQTLKWNKISEKWEITNTAQVAVTMDYVYSVAADGDYNFYAVVGNVGKKEVKAEGIKAKTGETVNKHIVAGFAKTLDIKSFYTCETLTQTTTEAGAAYKVDTTKLLTKTDPTEVDPQGAWVPVVKDSTPEQAKTNGGYTYAVTAASAYVAKEANAAEWKKFFAPSKAQFSPKA